MIKRALIALACMSALSPAIAQSPPFNASSIATLGGNCTTTGAIVRQASGGVTECLAPATDGTVLKLSGGVPSWATVSGTGTVSSVGLSLPSIFTVTGSPVTTTGTLTGTLASQSAARVFASPTGAAGTPTFRSLATTDLPPIPLAGGISGVLAIANGGTGQTTATDALTALGGLSTTTAASTYATQLNPTLFGSATLFSSSSYRPFFKMTSNSPGSDGSVLTFAKMVSNSTTLSGYTLGDILFQGLDTDLAPQTAVKFHAYQNGAASSGSVPGILALTVAPSATPTVYFNATSTDYQVPVKAPTASVTTGDTTLASTAYVRSAIGSRTLQSFGAIGDGTTDDTAAVSTALNANVPLTCDGQFRLTSHVTVNLSATAQKLTMTGSGRNGCMLVLDDPGAYITVNYSTIAVPFGAWSQHVTLSHLSIIANAVIPHAAVEFVGPAANGSGEPSLNLSDINIIPATNTGVYTTSGVLLTNMRNYTIESSTIQGPQNTFVAGCGICINSTTGGAPVDHHLRDNIVMWWNVAVDLQPNTGGTTTGLNDWEGVYIENNTLMGNICVQAQTLDNSTDLLQIRGGHCNFSTYAVRSIDTQNLIISDYYMLAGLTAINSPSTSYCVYDTVTLGESQYGKIHDTHCSFANAGAVATRVDYYVTQTAGAIFTNVHDNSSIGATAKFATLPASPVPHNNNGY